MFCSVQKPYLLILANLQSNKRQKKETLRFSHQHFAYTIVSRGESPLLTMPTRISLNVKFSLIPQKKNLESCSHFLASLINHRV